MTGFLLTVAALTGVMITLPFWEYSRKWGNAPSFLMGLSAFVFGFLWYSGKI